MKKKCFASSDVKINHIYEDVRGQQFLYLGKATESLMITGRLLEDNTSKYIYVDVKDLKKYPNDKDLRDVLYELHQQGNIARYYNCVHPKKMVALVDVDNREALHGEISFSYFMNKHELIKIFYFE